MRFGRSANKSNIVAVFMLQQRRPMPETKKTAGISALRPTGLYTFDPPPRLIKD